MNEIKITYRVDQSKSSNVIEKELEEFIYSSIENNLLGKKVISLSIRISHRPIPDKRQRYLIIINTDVNIVSLGIKEIMSTLISRIQSRKIDIKNIVSFHVHLNLA